ncbi:phosphoesterase RecJ domain protein [Hydrogenobacter thermophilus TK-6]|uniref:DHH family phosphoesterase n=1 Tax=Hydrogenobacter thermophilus TaxID=940 RepID=UPI0001E65651|nr:bifunctional oligoribonuclease/PAP phosphatase NrnA [Hydrogenobacter thermophilus]ADO45237.1 phosphoesterase RecJ domain protein [Hydrogenobacter thermophilus TK-6]
MRHESVPLIDLLKEEKGSILVFSHENPDADTLGSALALYLFLKKKGKNVKVGCKDMVPHFLDFLPHWEEIIRLPTTEVFDVGIVVDASGFYRAGTEVRAIRKVRIDHHIGGEFYGMYDYIDPSAPSTTAIIYQLLKLWDESAIDTEIAQCLYAGLATDTGFFKYSNTSAETFQMAKELVEKGADPHRTYIMFSERESLGKMKLISKVLDTLTLYEDGLVAGIVIYDRFFKETGTTYPDSEGLVNFPRSIEGVEVAFALIEKPDEGVWKVSLRSKERVNVASVASRLGGGGHKYASGCKIRASSASEAINMVLFAIKEELTEPSAQTVQCPA